MQLVEYFYSLFVFSAGDCLLQGWFSFFFFFSTPSSFLFQFLQLERKMNLRVEDKFVLGSDQEKIEAFIALLVERIIRILVEFPFLYFHNGLIPYP